MQAILFILQHAILNVSLIMHTHMTKYSHVGVNHKYITS